MSEQIPSIGRVVHFVLDTGPNRGQHRPAQIVRAWGERPDSVVNIQVLTDSNPADPTQNDCLPCPMWRTSVRKDDSGEVPGTWHWPEFVGASPEKG